MNRLLITLLTAFDAVIAAAAGIAVALAPLTLLWVFGLGGQADWAALWPAGAAIWQIGHLVPLSISLPDEYLAATGIPVDAASFTLSLAPLAFAVFTAAFAARSGARASRADGWAIGVVVGTVVFAAISALVAWTSATPVAAVEMWQAVLFPTLLFTVPALAGAVVTEWREAGAGVIARTRDRIEAHPHGWGEVPGLLVRGAAVVVVGAVGLGALAVAVALVAGGAQVIALFEAGHMDALGATVTTLAQLAYLPTLIVWGLSYVVGPGFAIGPGTVVSPAGTQVAIVPGIPVLGALPGSISPWMLLLALLPMALGAFAGWVVRSRLVYSGAVVAEGAPPEDEPIGARLTLAVGIAALSAGAVALLAVLASGSIGPAALAAVGPSAGPLALATGLEVLVGTAILLLPPRRRGARRRRDADGMRTGADREAIARSATDASLIVSAERWTASPYDAHHAFGQPRGAGGGEAADAERAPAAVDAEAAPGDEGAGLVRDETVPDEPPPPLVARDPQPGDAPAPRRPAPLPPVD